MKKIKCCSFVLAVVMMAGTLNGCGDTIPTLTEEENWKVAEYSAGLLIKYDAHNVRRLVSDNVIQAAYDEAYKKAEWEWKVEEYHKQQKEEELAAANSSSSGNGSGNSAQAVSYSMEEILGLDGSFQLAYTGYEVTDSYAVDESDDLFGAMEATKGNLLVVLHFDLTNLTEEDIFCDVIHQGVSFSATISGKKYGSQMTLLSDDLTQYYASVPAYSTNPVSIIFQLSEEAASNIQGISLKLKREDMSNRFELE